jgi:EAL domain-containing protein (putative c-di-GMP-specific phosphodiesterase class I)
LVLVMNITMSQLKDSEFSKKIRAICDVTQYPHQLLEFEVSEANLLRLEDSAASCVQSFVQQGLSLTVDAFGLSSRSMNILETFQISKIKFHQNLLKNIVHDLKVKRLVHTLSEKALLSEIQVMADGVLNADQCEEIQKIGCILGQGTFFDQPLSAKKFTEILNQKQFDLSSNFSKIGTSFKKSALSY